MGHTHENEANNFGFMLSVWLLAIIVTLATTYSCTDGAWKREAVRKGHAHYISTVDGDYKWEWKSDLNKPINNTETYLKIINDLDREHKMESATKCEVQR